MKSAQVESLPRVESPTVKLSSFKAVRYRGIDGLSLPSLSKANLVTGVNGVGKTALLEAMWLFAGRYEPSLLWNANVQRSGGSIIDPIALLTSDDAELHGTEYGKKNKVRFSFERMNSVQNELYFNEAKKGNNFNPIFGLIHTYFNDKLIESEKNMLIALNDGGFVGWKKFEKSSKILTSIMENAKFQYNLTDEHIQRFSNLVENGEKGKLIEAANLVLESIENIEIMMKDTGKIYLSATIVNEGSRPVHDLGGGAARLIRLLLGFSASQGGIFLLDEIENCIHYSTHGKIWDAMRKWMKLWDVQFVATTHSGEFIDAAIDAFSDAPDDLAIHKLFHNARKGHVDAVTFTGETLTGARELNMEVR